MASWVADDCQDLIKQLLQRKVEDRLGFVNDVEDLGDTTNVADKYLNQQVEDSYVAAPHMNEQEFFRGFTFRGADDDDINNMMSGGSISISAFQPHHQHRITAPSGDYQHILNNLSNMSAEHMGGIKE